MWLGINAKLLSATVRQHQPQETKVTTALRTWEAADNVYEGLVVDGVLKLYRYCCSLDSCPSSVQFDDIPQTEEEVRDFLGDDPTLLALLADPEVREVRIDQGESALPAKYRVDV